MNSSSTLDAHPSVDAQPPARVDGRVLRDVAGCFATGVTIVTTTAPDGRPFGITANSFTSLSLNPPLVLFNLSLSAYSLDTFTHCRGFAIHILARSQQMLSSRFAKAGGPKWEGLKYALGIGDAPVLPGAHAVLQCRVVQSHDAGDHRIFIGEVMETAVDDSVEPLLFYRGRYSSIGVEE